MDSGSFRTPQPDRRVVNRAERSSEPAPRQPEQPQPVNEEPKPVHRSTEPRQPKQEKKASKRWLVWVIVVIVVALLAVGGWFLWTNSQHKAVAIDSSKYQAVSFSDGQLYFGKLSVVNDDYMKLSDVYYLQPQTTDSSSSNLQNSTSNASNFKLVKFTDVIYGPEGDIVIPKGQVLFYENLQSDGKVAQLINQYTQGK